MITIYGNRATGEMTVYESFQQPPVPEGPTWGQVPSPKTERDVLPIGAQDSLGFTITSEYFNRPQYVGQAKDSTHKPFYRSLPKKRRRR